MSGAGRVKDGKGSDEKHKISGTAGNSEGFNCQEVL
jgi:hypothetical protein